MGMDTLDLTIKTKKLKLKMPDGKTVIAELRELTGTLRDEYQTLVSGKIKMDDKGQPTGFVNMAGLAGELLSRTLFNRDDGGKPFKKEVISEWPSRVLDTLFVESRKLSALDKTEFVKEGND